ncbi:LysR family transcriptional regulator [Acinetobacter lactucae]|uniref:LysR substrate-binding domain-containing protein n=1 Tax=Acinetobacter lactucae TaxID=1785128 RepID=A0AB35K0F2_9GAMM|nr:LysR family transcriptional regulator [Acinetobacter lactucae]MDD9315192.1 LysR substrate-binding domain-containing protein [Acinetobacter lactucae]MDD9319310.1 LysR substrate-binding domain-containing protein [Acinetobacter lactucae]
MEALSNLESFVRSAEQRSFSAAARLLALTPAAVSRNVAQLEKNLGVQLFQRSTRKLLLTEAGEQFLHAVKANLAGIQAAIADISQNAGQPAGTLRLSLSPGFGLEHILPLMPGFLARYPSVRLDWQLSNRQVHLVEEGFDAAIGGGIELAPGVIARRLAPVHVIWVVAPALLQGRAAPTHPAELSHWPAVQMRSPQSGKLHQYGFKGPGGETVTPVLDARFIADDPDALTHAALLGMGVAALAMPHAVTHLLSGRLVRILPDWYADLGSISMYFNSHPAGSRLMPAKTRVFIDYLVAEFERLQLAAQFNQKLTVLR